MNIMKSFLWSSLLGGSLLLAFVVPQTSEGEKEKIIVETMMRALQSHHYAPLALDDAFSTKAFDNYLDYLDNGKRFLLQPEVDQLASYRHQIDDQLKSGSFELFDQSVTRLEQALQRSQQYYRDILAQPFDFSKSGNFELNPDKREFAKDEAELRQHWFEYMKYETLERYADNLEKREKGEEDFAGKSDVELETKAREDVLKLFDRWFERMYKLDREDRLSQYLNAIAGIFDPHTNYYKPIDKENFDIRFSGKLEGIGARLLTDGDYTKVSEIVVGGPAWKGKELDENDVITRVAQDGEEAVDIKGMDIDDVVQLIRGPKDTKVHLTVNKVDGTSKTVTIVRDVVIIDESFAKSLLIDGAAPGELIGYIYLPSFYADFEDVAGRHCADDVAKELDKLKAAGVDGIILDLRNNGGGSLRDVVKMSGFFIESGPIVQVNSRNASPEVLPDVDPNVQYGGAMVVMVNNFSASASEILAAALQDYGRAVIVGSNSTFGKGTVQRFVDLDRLLRGMDAVKPLGSIKLTMQKFYRINGGSTQLRGVTPDIVLPDEYALVETGEKENEYPMPWTEIAAVEYGQNVLRIDHMDKIKQRSMARVARSEVFNKVKDNAQRLKDLREETASPLALVDYQTLQASRKEEAEQYKTLFDAVVIPSARNLAIDLPAIEADEAKKERNKDFLESVTKDVYIQEVIHILHDIIELERVALRD